MDGQQLGRNFKEHTVMRTILWICILVMVACCTQKKAVNTSSELADRFIADIDSLKNLYQNIIDPVLQPGWVDEFSWYLKEQFPVFTIDYSLQSYRVVPSYEISSNEMIKDTIDFTHYLGKGKMSIANSMVLVMEDGKILGSFRLKKNESSTGVSYILNPVSFHNSFRESKLNQIIENSELVFEFSILHDGYSRNIPGIIFYDTKGFHFFSRTSQEIYPVSELYLDWIVPEKEKFRSFVNWFYEENSGSLPE
jgi:hypothetical protein